MSFTSIAPYAFWFFAISAAMVIAAMSAYMRGWHDGWKDRDENGRPILRHPRNRK